MKFKKTAIAAPLIFASQLLIGATYTPYDDQEFDFSDPSMSSTSSDKLDLDKSFYDIDLPESFSKSNKLKQEYLNTFKLLKNNQLIDAENEITHLIQQYPNQANFYNLRGSLELLKKEPNLAIKSYEKAITLDNDNVRSHLGLATAYLQTKQLTQARQYANKALSINKELTPTYILLAEIAFQENKHQEAENLLLTAMKKAYGNKPQEIVVSNRLAQLYVLQKQLQKALTVAENINKRYPNDSSALSLLAKSLVVNKQTAQAIPILEKLIHLEDNDIQHRLLLAKLLLTPPKDENKILTLLSEVNALAPKDLKIQVARAILFIQIKQYPEALQTAKKVKKIAPETGLAEALEGEIYLAEKKQDLALAAFQKSYNIKPNTKVFNAIIKLMIAQGQQADLINFLDKEIQKNPKNLEAHFSLGNIYQQQNNNQEAEKHYLAILAKQPDNAVILNNLAWIYHLENNPKALEFAEKAYKKAPKSAAVADTYAVILVKQGELNKGLKIFEQAGRLAPNNYDIQYHLADAYAAKGQNQKAIQILKPITQSEQNFTEKQAAISLLEKLN